MKKSLFSLAIFFAVFSTCFAQPTFIKTIDTSSGLGNVDEDLNSMTQSIDGGYVLTGRSYSLGSFYIAKLDSSGNMVWQKNTLNSVYTNNNLNIISSKDGGYVVAGLSHQHHRQISKLDKNGKPQWSKYYSYDSVQQIFPLKIIQTYDGGYIVSGVTNKPWKPFLFKTDSVGNLQRFEYLFPNGDSTATIKHVINTKDSANALLMGLGNKLYLLKLSREGKFLWARSFADANIGSEGLNHFNVTFKETSDRGFIIISDAGYFGSKIYVLKTDSVGTHQWYRQIAVPQIHSYARSVIETNNNYIIEGLVINDGYNEGNPLVIKLDNSGNIKWSRLIKASQSVSLQDYSRIIRSGDGGFVLGCTSFLNAKNYRGFTLIKFDSEGKTCLPYTNEGTSSKFKVISNIESVTIKKINNIRTILDTVRLEIPNKRVLSICSGFTQVANVVLPEMQKKSTKINAWPNPVKDKLILEMSTTGVKTAYIQLVNMNGRAVQNFSFGIKSGLNLNSVNTSALNPGVYILKIIIGTEQQKIKFIKE